MAQTVPDGPPVAPAPVSPEESEAPPSQAASADQQTFEPGPQESAPAPKAGPARGSLAPAVVPPLEEAPPVLSFGDGAELSRTEGDRSPSPAAGVEDLEGPESDGNGDLSSPYAPGRAPVTEGPDPGWREGPEGLGAVPDLAVPPSRHPQAPPMGPGSYTPLPPASRMVPPEPPVPPPVQSDPALRLVYQLQTDVYGLQVALAGRPIVPRYIYRIDMVRAEASQLGMQVQGYPGMAALAREVEAELLVLRQAAVLRDRAQVFQSLQTLETLLGRLRAPGARAG